MRITINMCLNNAVQVEGCILGTRESVDKLIETLKVARDKAFPKENKK